MKKDKKWYEEDIKDEDLGWAVALVVMAAITTASVLTLDVPEELMYLMVVLNVVTCVAILFYRGE